jgi:4-hydroxybenzoate polyprenyltransferase
VNGGRLLDALLYSSVWVAAAAAALFAAASRAMGAPVSGAGVALAFSGTLAIYALDRLRDLERDRVTAPQRSLFVERHRSVMTWSVGVSLVCAGAIVLAADLLARIWVLAPALVLGVLHRRLKRFAWAKALYIAFAWGVVTVGLPAVLATSPERVGWVAAVVLGTILANVIASNLRDGESATAVLGAHVPLRLARATAAAVLCVALLAPGQMRPLALVPLATLAALVPFRADERYGHLVVDGALLVGAAASLPLY